MIELGGVTMDKHFYAREMTKKTIAHVESDGTMAVDGNVRVDGETMIFESLPATNYSDSTSVKTLASLATHTADGIYNLVTRNCDVDNPDLSYDAHIELYLSLSSLACEIYMKAIIYFENRHSGVAVTGHDLVVLFGKLSTSAQSTIASNVANVVSTLPAIKNMFVLLRYNYEHTSIHGNYFDIFKLMKELRTIAHSFQQVDVGSVVFNDGKVVIE